MSERVEASDADWGGEAEALQQFRTLVATVDGGVYRLDTDGRFDAVDDDFRDLIGYERDDLRGEHVSLVLSETDTERLEERLAERLATDDRRLEPFDLEVTVRTAGGESIPCEVRIGPLTDDGELRGTIGVVRDVSERRRRRQRDRELEQYRAITEAASDVIVTIDAESTVRTVNPAVETVFGYEPDELIGESLTTLMPDGLADEHREALTRYLETGDRTLDWEYVELPGVRADGTEIPLGVSFSEVEYDGERYFTGIIRDISEREARERELRRKERRYEAVFEDPNILVGLLEPDGTVLDINGTAMEYIDADLADVTGEPFWETPWWGEGDDVGDDVKRWTERAAAGEYVDFETDLTRPDGQGYTLSGYFRPVTNDDGEVVSIIVSDRDVTERKEHERELELFRTLVDHSTDSVLVIDPETGRFLDVNDTACERRGYSEAEFLDLTVPDIETEIPDHEAWRSFVEELRAERFRTFDGSHRRKDGSTYPVEVNASYVELDQEYVFAVARDVTERRAYERKLEERERQLSTLMDNVPGMVYRCENEPGWPMEFVSDACEEVTGYDPGALERGELSWGEDIMLDADRQGLWETVQQAAGESETFSETYRIETADGERRWVRDYGRGVVDDGDLVIEGIIADVTERKERERELEQYRRIVETIDEGVYVLDGDNRFITVNEAFASMLGTDRESLIGAHASVAFGEEQVAKGDDLQREMLAGETDVAELEEQLLTDDEPIPVVSRFRPLAIGDDVGRVGVARDVTEREERKRELERYAEQLETLFDVLPVGVVVAEADGEIVEANDVAHEIWGGDVFDAGSVDEYERYPVRWADSGEPVEPEEMTLARVTAGEEVTEPDVVEIEAVDGERRIVELEGMPIRDENGDVSRGVVTVSDVTERREAQRRLAESERLYRTLAERFPNGTVGVYDHELRYTLAAGEKVGGPAPSAAEVEGTRMPDLYPDDAVDDLEPLFRAAVEDGETGSTRTEVVGRHWKVWATPLRDADGEIFAGLSYAQDITERIERERRLEELVDRLEESNERLQQFAYAASHDLQEPLRMVSSYLQLLESRYADELDDDAAEFIDYAVDGAERMKAMIDGLLEYSRVDTRGDPLEPIELDDVLEDVLADLQLTIEEHDAEIRTEPLPRVEGDADQLRQVFQNLLDNAIEYSGDEPPRIEITAERRGERWTVSVADEGIGLEADDQERIFDVFQRLHSREEHAGTGIGLALCERIVERHGGEIWVESEPGEGSTFAFTLPAVDE
ncbi:PAS domain S-box protein [Haloterrigena salinisoli]|uniref:PAS domain S-box protein n=1 Tax=Haloterrigena salinisoli TaxID=3132747 RepID=UPI0030D23E31